MVRADTTALAEIVRQCFDNSTDGRFTPEQRERFLADGNRLRGSLMNLLSAEFDGATQEVANANEAIQAVNAELKISAAKLAQAATTLNNVARLIGTLDRLLSAVVRFV